MTRPRPGSLSEAAGNFGAAGIKRGAEQLGRFALKLSVRTARRVVRHSRGGR